MNSRLWEVLHQAMQHQIHEDQNPPSRANDSSTLGTTSGYNSNSQYYRGSVVESYSNNASVGKSSNHFHGSQSSGYRSVENHNISHSVGTSSVEKCDREEHLRYPSLDPQHSSSGVKSTVPSFQPTSRGELRSGSCNSQGSDRDKIDAELLRKKNKLREIEEQILKLKASIGVESTETFEKTAADTLHQNPPLRVRVMELLQQRHSPGFFSKAEKTRLKSWKPNKESPHPLQLRVKALMELRDKDPSALLAFRKDYNVAPSSPPPSKSTSRPAESESTSSRGFERFINILNQGGDQNLFNPDPDLSISPPPSMRTSPPVERESTSSRGFERFINLLNQGGDQDLLGPGVSISPPPSKRSSPPEESASTSSNGFERFLNILNKGVDLDMLSRIVTDDTLEPPDGEEILSFRQPDVEDASQMDDLSDIQLVEDNTKAEAQRRERDLHEDKGEKSERKKRRRSSGSQSKSPKAGKRREEEKEEEVRKVDEQQEQLQKVLRALGMSLEADELSQLSNRTQERLYGRKTATRVQKERSPSSSSSSHSSRSRSPSTSTRSNQRPQYGANLERSDSGSGSGSRGGSSGQHSGMRGLDEHEWRNESKAVKEATLTEPPYSRPQPSPSTHVAPSSGSTSSPFPQYNSPAPPRYWSGNGFSLSQKTAPQSGPYGAHYAQSLKPNLAESESQSSILIHNRSLKTVVENKRNKKDRRMKIKGGQVLQKGWC